MDSVIAHLGWIEIWDMDTCAGMVLQAHIAVIMYNTGGSMLQRRDKRKVFNLIVLCGGVRKQNREGARYRLGGSNGKKRENEG
jgi:hypothetical protein